MPFQRGDGWRMETELWIAEGGELRAVFSHPESGGRAEWRHTPGDPVPDGIMERLRESPEGRAWLLGQEMAGRPVVSSSEAMRAQFDEMFGQLSLSLDQVGRGLNALSDAVKKSGVKLK